MSQRECGIIGDLLPSYIEQLTNATTNSVVEAHLQECRKCRNYYQELQFEYEEQNNTQSKLDKKFLGKLKRYRYQTVGSLIGVLLTLVLIGCGIKYMIDGSALNNKISVHTEDTEQYREFEVYDGISKLSLFPSVGQIKESGATLDDYVYDCQGHELYQTYQLYLECTYSKQEYEKEVERLLQTVNSKTGNAAVYSEELFAYPAVYAMRNAEGCNEYALLLEQEQKIIYIYLQGGIDRRELYFEESYLPLDYGQNGMMYEEEEIYSIYEKDEL